MSNPIPIPPSIALTTGSISYSEDECFSETSRLMDPDGVLFPSQTEETAELNYCDEELKRLQATVFLGLEEDSEKTRFLEFPKNTARIDLDPLLSAAEMMGLTFLDPVSAAMIDDNCEANTLSFPLSASTLAVAPLSQAQSLAVSMENRQYQQTASFSFLAPVNVASFQDQESPRKRGRPTLVRMDALPNRRTSSSSPSSPCSRAFSIRCITNFHSPRSASHQGPSSWSTGPACMALALTPSPLSSPAPMPMITPSDLTALPYDYFPCLPQSDASTMSSLSLPTSPFSDWTSISSSPYSSMPMDTHEPASSLFSPLPFPTSSPLSSQSASQLSPSPSLSSSKNSKMNPVSSSSPTEFFIMHPYQHSDKKIDRRSFNSRKELKHAQAQAHALAQSQDRSSAM
ncbi:hypothetical protein EMPS_01288 [Entomortierella parvispora]|uniref:Uncharacterized protein n=1 Tax=Entomortierella parvispora TaxID=205924 RepID=A0A9P3H3A1_9FUNG|nr:hypothetical protein EMPS_01288 [Entomortierella parvispora]